jgi:molybdenum cofactor guanylyltransferase
VNVLGVILAGGRSSRFGSDKALAMVNGRPLIDHVAESLSGQCDALVVAGRIHDGYRCVADRPATGMGPLAGLAGALHHASIAGFGSVLSVGVDALNIPADLRTNLEPAPAYVVGQPVIGLWPVSALALLAAILGSDERHSMLHFVERIGARSVILENPPANINTPSDLQNLGHTI